MKSRSAFLLSTLTALVPVVALSQSDPTTSTETQTPSLNADAGTPAAPENADAGTSTTSSTNPSTITASGDAATATSSTNTTSTVVTAQTTTPPALAGQQTTESPQPNRTPIVTPNLVPAPSTPPPATPSPPRKKEDDGRSIDFLFIQPEFGASYTHIGAIQRMGRLQPELVEFQGWGWGGGVTAGFRVWLFAVAAHAYVHRFDGTGINLPNLTQPMSPMPAPAHFDLGQLMLDAHLRIPLPIVEPYIRVGFGYAWMGSFQINDRYRDSVAAVHGWTAKLGAGADFWIGKWFSLGAGFDLSIVNLRRGGVISPSMTCPTTDPTCVDLTMEGNAIGLTAATHIQATLHL